METAIMEQNKLIADFMGWVHSDNEDLDRYEMNGLKYHESWNWLMPVVEKIANVKYGAEHEVDDYAYPRTFGMKNTETGDFMVRFNRCGLYQAPTLIEATYLAVVDYVQSATTLTIKK